MPSGYTIVLFLVIATVAATIFGRQFLNGPSDELKAGRRGIDWQRARRSGSLDETLASSIEHDPMLVVRENERAGEVIDLLHESDAAAFPVTSEGGELRGMVTAADLAWHAAHEPRATIGSFVRPVPATLVSSETLERAAALLTDPAIALVPIVDAASGRLMAVVTRRDILAAYRSLAKK